MSETTTTNQHGYGSAVPALPGRSLPREESLIPCTNKLREQLRNSAITASPHA